jgi:hypothetical protein
MLTFTGGDQDPHSGAETEEIIGHLLEDHLLEHLQAVVRIAHAHGPQVGGALTDTNPIDEFLLRENQESHRP